MVNYAKPFADNFLCSYNVARLLIGTDKTNPVVMRFTACDVNAPRLSLHATKLWDAYVCADRYGYTLNEVENILVQGDAKMSDKPADILHCCGLKTAVYWLPKRGFVFNSRMKSANFSAVFIESTVKVGISRLDSILEANYDIITKNAVRTMCIVNPKINDSIVKKRFKLEYFLTQICHQTFN